MLYQLFALGVIAYLPGAVIFRLPIADRWRRSSLPAEERCFWAVFISLSLSSTIALGLAAVEQYSFERLLTANTILSLVSVLLARGRLRLIAEAPRPGLTVLAPLALIALGAWLYFPTSEYIIGGRDPGVYVNEGIQIAQRGALVTRDPQVASLPPTSRDLFIPRDDNDTYYGLRFMGYFVTEPASGKVVAQFPHLYPAWVSIGYGLNGLTGARQVIGIWAILGLLALYFVGARAVGTLPALTGSALLAIHVTQVWFSRYPNSELVLQATLLAALLAFARVHIDGDRFFGPLAATLLGLSLFARLPAILAWVAVCGACLAGAADGRRLHSSFVGPAILWLGLATWYFVAVLAPYTAQPIGFVQNLQTVHILLLALGATVGVLLTVAIRSETGRRQIRRWLPVVVTSGVILAATYAYFLRTPGGRLAPHDAFALRTYAAYYLTPYGLIAALLGFALLVRRSFWLNSALILSFVTFSFFFFYKIRIVPEHFWMTRRFLPIILPMSMLLITTAAFWGVGSGWPRALRKRITLVGRVVIGLAFVGLLSRQYLAASRPLLNHIEYEGVISKLEELAGQFGDRDLVIVESRAASDLHVLALPLAYIYGRNVLVFSESKPNRTAFLEFLTWARTQYQHIFFLGGGRTDLLSFATVKPVGSERFQIPEYQSLLNAYPRTVNQKEFDFGVYQFDETIGVPGPFSLDVGTMDDLHVVEFHSKERSSLLGGTPQSGEQLTFRWSREKSRIAILNTPVNAQVLTLWMSDGDRPDNVIPARVAVYLDEILLGDVVITNGFHPYTFSIPPDFAAVMAERRETTSLTLLTNTWNPSRVLSAPDNRDLGVMVDRVEIQ